jgi:DNA invertase Pin-like site-specific DNA recombinase
MNEPTAPTGSRIGYGRVSTRDQNPDSQHDELKAAGCTRIFIDRGVSGKLAKRPELDACLDYLRPGDTLVITRLSRAMRSLRHLLEMSHDLKERGIGLMVIKQPIDTTSAQGRMVFAILGAVDEFQRELIVENTHEGLAAARARGREGGRRPKLSEDQKKLAREMVDKQERTMQQIADVFHVSRQTVYRALNDEKV